MTVEKGIQTYFQGKPLWDIDTASGRLQFHIVRVTATDTHFYLHIRLCSPDKLLFHDDVDEALLRYFTKLFSLYFPLAKPIVVSVVSERLVNILRAKGMLLQFFPTHA